ncbi:MAG TPA: hypothetical protein VGA04_32400 [Streptosporangiaceae bacterium]
MYIINIAPALGGRDKVDTGPASKLAVLDVPDLPRRKWQRVTSTEQFAGRMLVVRPAR